MASNNKPPASPPWLSLAAVALSQGTLKALQKLDKRFRLYSGGIQSSRRGSTTYIRSLGLLFGPDNLEEYQTGSSVCV